MRRLQRSLGIARQHKNSAAVRCTAVMYIALGQARRKKLQWFSSSRAFSAAPSAASSTRLPQRWTESATTLSLRALYSFGIGGKPAGR